MSANSIELPVARDPGNGASLPVRMPRGRLFRKYVLFFVGLVAVALLVNTAFDFWFGYRENKAVMIHMQQEKANAAAQRIKEFVESIERQIGWTTHAQWAAAPLDQRRFDYVRLLRQVPAITEISELDGDGKERLKVSRLAMDVIGSGQDFSQATAFTEAQAHKVWFSPIYFRKESEPYMTLAMARAGRGAGVTVAEVNLKLIWDVITGMKIGQGGYAYVVDGRGRLIAHPDISLVLRDTDFQHLPQVAAALSQNPRAPAVSVARNSSDRSVLSAHAAIAPPGWLVFVEVPLGEAFAPLLGAATRGAVLLVVGLAGATLAALFLARRMTGPIRVMQEGAAQIGAGDLDRRLDVRTGDELEALAQQFNRMAGDLQKSYAELEQKVEERTAELSEALEQQTATAEVLGVINSSPGDLAPVLDAMLEKAVRLCDGTQGIFWTYDGEQFQAAAFLGVSAEFAATLRQPVRLPPESPLGRAAHGEPFVQILDMADTDAYRSGFPLVRAVVDLGRVRSLVVVPLVKDGTAVGIFAIARSEVRPFTDKQIALLQNFAAQAVIAMENARLMTETREALEQQTATAEVLGVINSSPGNLAPVFDAMLEKALHLCEASFGVLLIHQDDGAHVMASRNLPAAYADYLTREPLRLGPETLHGRAIATRSVIQVADFGAEEPYHNRVPLAVAAYELGGVRTAALIPLLKDDSVPGLFLLYRQEVRPFTDKQIALLQNFAAQAVIAMENARLITETREALEQQTATAEVLGVINSSPGDLAPVFDAMLEKAMRLCEAAFGQLAIREDGRFRTAATRNMPEAFVKFRQQNPPDYGPGTQPARLLAGERIIHIADMKAEEIYAKGEPNRRALVDLGGVRTSLMVPLLRDDTVLGFINFYREEVRPFSDKQVALLQNFAAQAVIAMENARLLGELRERTDDLQESLEFQTATSDVLKVISRSDSKLTAVLNNLLETATRICSADHGYIFRLQDDQHHLVAAVGVGDEFKEFLAANPFRPDRGTLSGRVALERRVVHIEDAASDPEYTWTQAQQLGNLHTGLGVPLLRDSTLLGIVILYRSRVERFSDKQIELVTTFADQAVIAIENARLLNETREARDDAESALSELKMAQANLIQAEKMASLGQLTAGIAHEIKNPLNFVNNFAGLSNELLDELKEIVAPAIEALDDDRRAELDEVVDMLTGNLEKIAEHGRRADGIVKSMLAHSRGGSGDRQVVDLNALLEESLNLAYHGARAQDQNFNITLEREFDPVLKPIELVPQDIARVFLNLFGNGFYAANKRAHIGGNVDFRPVLHVATHDAGDAVEIRVRDNGTGIPSDIRDKLFQPFFTTKPTGEGTGLGLSISYDIVTQQHGGTIAVDSEEGAFTEFTIRLPRTQASAARANT